MNATVQDRGDRRTLVVEGEIDHENINELVDALEKLTQSTDTEIDLDFTGLAYIDSAGICALYDLADRLEGQKTIRVTGLSQALRRVFHIAGLLVHGSVQVETDPEETGVVGENPFSRLEGGTASWRRSFSCRLDQLAEVRAFIEEVAARVPLDESRSFNLKLAVSEATANAVEHGGNEGDIKIIAIRSSDRIMVMVTHPGDFHPRHRVIQQDLIEAWDCRLCSASPMRSQFHEAQAAGQAYAYRCFFM